MSKQSLAVILVLLIGFAAFQQYLIVGYQAMNSRLVSGCLNMSSAWVEAKHKETL